MNIFEYVSKCEANFEHFLNSVGKERKTIFYADLSIAEWFGVEEVYKTYKRVMDTWGDDLEFMCEWVIALNQKIWQLYDTDKEMAQVYNQLWQNADEYCMNHFKGDDLTAYLKYVD